MISRETKIPLTAQNLRDIEDAEILDAIGMGLADPDICLLLCVPGGRVTAMREVVDQLDLEEADQ